jgi:hypothetical protein
LAAEPLTPSRKRKDKRSYLPMIKDGAGADANVEEKGLISLR